jgi:glutamine amidotransferase
MSLVAIVDTGLSNLDSVARAIEECGGTPLVTDEPSDLAGADRIILPGVGAFPEAIDRLRILHLEDALREHVIVRERPFLGVCLGMQLLASRGSEVRESGGLGWIDGDVRLLEPRDAERMPHIGWNEVDASADSPLFRGISPRRDFYFVHSYVLWPTRQDDIAARTPYGGGFVSAVQRGNVFGVQFHPEKSQQAGFAVLRNFLAT